MSKGKDEAFEKAYASVVENGWTNVKHMARQVWDMASATHPAAQVQGEQPVVVGQLALDEPFNGTEGLEIGEWEFVPERAVVESMLAVSTGEIVPLMTVAQHERIVAALKSELAMATDAAAKGDAARQQCDGMESEIAELRAELAACREIAEHNAQAFGEKLKQVESMRAALSAPPAAGVLAEYRIQLCKLGRFGAAYDPTSTHYAYTYSDQPDNVAAMKLGRAAATNATKSHGDGIDRGLHLLWALQAEGFGVFHIDTHTPPASEQQQAVVMEELLTRVADWCDMQPKHDWYGRTAGDMVRTFMARQPTPPQENDR